MKPHGIVDEKGDVSFLYMPIIVSDIYLVLLI